MLPVLLHNGQKRTFKWSYRRNHEVQTYIKQILCNAKSICFNPFTRRCENFQMRRRDGGFQLSLWETWLCTVNSGGSCVNNLVRYFTNVRAPLKWLFKPPEFSWREVAGENCFISHHLSLLRTCETKESWVSFLRQGGKRSCQRGCVNYDKGCQSPDQPYRKETSPSFTLYAAKVHIGELYLQWKRWYVTKTKRSFKQSYCMARHMTVEKD